MKLASILPSVRYVYGVKLHEHFLSKFRIKKVSGKTALTYTERVDTSAYVNLVSKQSTVFRKRHYLDRLVFLLCIVECEFGAPTDAVPKKCI